MKILVALFLVILLLMEENTIHCSSQLNIIRNCKFTECIITSNYIEAIRMKPLILDPSYGQENIMQISCNELCINYNATRSINYNLRKCKKIKDYLYLGCYREYDCEN